MLSGAKPPTSDVGKTLGEVMEKWAEVVQVEISWVGWKRGAMVNWRGKKKKEKEETVPL